MGFLQIIWVTIIFTTDWIKPWGTIFVNLLKLIAVPLFLHSIKGVALSDISIIKDWIKNSYVISFLQLFLLQLVCLC